MDNSPARSSSIDWPVIKRMLQSGTQIDVQFNETEQPISYAVVMTLESPMVFCLAIDKVDPSAIEKNASPMVFIPTVRDLCSLRMAIKGWAEGGRYLALSPLENVVFLRHRRSIRIKTPENISYRVQFEGRSNIYKGIAVQDISRGGLGLLVYAASPIQEDIQARLEITLPRSNKQISAIGSVSHCIPHGNLPRMYRIGIQFTRISPHDKQTIAMYIDQHLNGPQGVKKA